MARDIETIERRIGLNPIQLPTPNVSSGVIQVLQGFTGLVSGIGEAAATESAAIEGVLARERGDEVSIAPGITRPTAAFNKSYRDTDARLTARAGVDLIADEIVSASNPASLNSGSLERYQSRVEGILDGVLSKTLPENRSAVKDALLNAANQGKHKIQQKVLNFQNQEFKQTFKLEHDTLEKDLVAALHREDEALAESIKVNIDSLQEDWGNMSQEIASAIPSLQVQLAESEEKARQMGKFLTANDKGLGDEYTRAFFKADDKSMRPQMKLELLSEMVKISNLTDAAQSGSQALAKARLSNDISDPSSETHITTQQQLEDTDDYWTLNAIQKEQIKSVLFNANMSDLRKTAKLSNIASKIANGQSDILTSGDKSEFYNAMIEQTTQELGRNPNFLERFNIVRGIGSNVSEFDSNLTTMLTKTRDPDTALQAAQLYTSAGIDNLGYLINLEGEAASIAESLRTLLLGTDIVPTEAVKGVFKIVLDKTHPEIIERNEKATSILSKEADSMYEKVTGVPPDAFSDTGAFETFKQLARFAFINGNTAEEAVRISKNGMKGFNQDRLFPKGVVARYAPSIELPLSQGTQCTRNQMEVAFHNISNRFNATLTPENSTQRMEFAEKFEFPEKLNQTDFVFKAIDEQKRFRETPDFRVEDTPFVPTEIRVIVNGVESDLKLQSNESTGRKSSTGLVYGLLAADANGVYYQLQDPASPDGLAYVVLQDVDQVAPGVMNTLNDERLNKSIDATLGKKREREGKEMMKELFQTDIFSPAFPRLLKRMEDFKENKKGREELIEEVKQKRKSNEERGLSIGKLK